MRVLIENGAAAPVLVLVATACGGAVAAPTEPRQELPTPARAEASILAGASGAWTDDPLFFDVDLPFREGVTIRPCLATYSVMGDDRLEQAFEYEGSRLVAVELTVGEQAGEGHTFCLPTAPIVRLGSLDPLRLTLAYDAEGRLASETIATRGEADAPLSSATFVRDESGRLVAVEREGPGVEGAHEAVEWEDGHVVVRSTDIGRLTVSLDARGRVARLGAGVGESSLRMSYAYDDAGRLVEMTREHYEDSDEPYATETMRFEHDRAGRLASCTLESSEGSPLRVVYTYVGERLVRRAAIEVESGEEAWAWQYRYECGE